MLIAIVMPVPVSPSDGPGLIGGPSGSPVMLIVPPHACAGVNDTRVERADRLITEPQPLDRSGRHVLDHDVGLLRHVLDERQAALGFEVDGDRFLVGVEFEEIERVRAVGRPGEGGPTGLAALRVLDLDDLGAEPGERLGAGGSRLELGQVEDPDPGKTLQRRTNTFHHSNSFATILELHDSAGDPPSEIETILRRTATKLVTSPFRHGELALKIWTPG